jgi:putative endopeptidase
MKRIRHRRHPVLWSAAFVVMAASAAAAQKTSTVFEKANMDTTCAACQDFYEYANGGWLKTAMIPPSQTSLGSFSALNDHNRAVVHTILSDDSAAVQSGAAKVGTERWKSGTFYTACMDTAAITALGIQPLAPTLDAIAAIQSPADLVRTFASAERRGGLAPFSVNPGADPKNSRQTIVNASQGGLSLPERDYYFRTDPRSADIRANFLAHVARTFELLGEATATASTDANSVMALEMKFATATVPRAQLRDPNASYHKLSIAELDTLTPHIDWRQYLNQLGGAHGRHVATVNVRTPSFFASLDTLLTAVPISDWKSYLRWRAANAAAPTLGTPFIDEAFRWSQVMSGVEKPAERWQACEAATNVALGWAVGHEYVKRTFSRAARTRAAAMVDNLVSALRHRIKQLDWMSAATKTEAVAKLDAFLRKVAYPDTWRDYTTLAVRPRAYRANVLASAQWNRQRSWARVGKPVDRSEWSMVPPTVNASYSPSLNQIQFPAGILQPPFFNPDADDAVNYGAMGAVIGHEMSHGFDDNGRQFDAKGNLRDWWTAADAAKYKTSARLIVDQFNGYTVIDSMTHVNGQNTLGENIGDLGGLAVAYAAMETALAKKGRPATIDGFTAEQRFFLSWAQIWREVQRPEAERLQVNTNPHAPGKWRVNGPLSNMPEFAKAFGCKAGDAMVRPETLRARIW